jgi:hypothetical protein
VVLLLGIAAVASGVAAVAVSLGPVPRPRLDQFVARAGVSFTAANAPYVLDALARTTRWRTAGVVVAVAIWLAWDVLHETLAAGTYTGVVLATGFLVGSVVGEVGNAVSRGPGPRSASLIARREQDYVGSWARTWPMAVTLISLLAAPIVAAGRREPVGAGILLAIVLAAWAAGRWCTRLVLERQRPSDDDPDVVAADDGLRSRALHAVGGAVVLAAVWSAIALIGFGLVGDAPDGGLVAGAAFALMAVVARVAWRRATGAFLVVDASVRDVVHGEAREPVREGPAA